MSGLRICFKPWMIFMIYLIDVQLLTEAKSNITFPIFASRHRPPEKLQDPAWGVHKFIEIQNISLHYVENGDPSKPLMLLVHGFPEFWYSWRYQLTEFYKDYWTIALDQPGIGDSGRFSYQSDYHIDNLVRVIRDLIRKLGRSKFIYIGHSSAALIGWRYVALHMDTIDKYIMMGAASLEIVWHNMKTNPRQFIGSFDVLFYQVPVVSELALESFDMGFMKTIQGLNKRGTISDEDIEAYKYTYGKPGALTAALNFYRANIPPHLEELVRDKTKDAPGLVVFGENDKFTIRKSITQLQQDYFNLEYQEIKDTSHFLQQDNPKEVNRIIREFLEKK